MVKTHIDLNVEALRLIASEKRALLEEMQRRGVLFSLDTSRTRVRGQGTERYQVRRILLVKHVSPLGRRDPIKLDTGASIVWLLDEPMAFAQHEIGHGGQIRMELE